MLISRPLCCIMLRYCNYFSTCAPRCLVLYIVRILHFIPPVCHRRSCQRPGAIVYRLLASGVYTTCAPTTEMFAAKGKATKATGQKHVVDAPLQPWVEK